MAEEDLILNIIEKSTGNALRDSADDLDHTADSADHAGKSFHKFGNESGFVDSEITRLRGNIRNLTSEIDRTGNTSLFKNVKIDRSQLREFEKLKKILTPDPEEFKKGFLSSLGDLGMSLRGSMTPILIGAAVAAGPGIAAAVGAAVVGGIGLGGVIGGIALASQDPRVPAAFKPVGRQMLAGLTQDAKVFVTPLVELADDIGQGWEDRIRPHIAAMFENLAPSLDNLGAGGIGFLEHLTAGFEAVSEAAGPFLDQLGADLPELGADMERFLRSIAEAGPAITQFMHDFDNALGGTLVGLGKLVQFGAEFNEIFPIGGVVTSLGRLSEATDTNVKANDAWIRSLFGVTGALMNLRHFTEGNLATDAAAKAIATAKSMAAVNVELVKQAANAAAAGAANQGLTVSFQNAAAAANGLMAAFNALNGAELTQREATRQAEEALDNFQAALKASKGSLSIHTEAGRAAARAMDALAGKAAEAAQAILDNGGTVEEAKAAYDHYVGALRKTLTQAGFTKKQIDDLISTIAKMPPSKAVSIKQAGAQGAKAAVDALRTSINNLRSKTVFVTSIVQSIVQGAKAGAHAAGTPSAPRGLAWVGEEGPELISLRGGERIYPHPQSMAMATAAHYARGNGGRQSSGGTTRIEAVWVAPPGVVEDAIGEIVRRFVHFRGGDPVAALAS